MTNNYLFINKLLCSLLFLAVPLITIPICSTIIYQFYQVSSYDQSMCYQLNNTNVTEIWGEYSHCDGYAYTHTSKGDIVLVHLVNPAIDYYLIQVSYQECTEWVDYYSKHSDYVCYFDQSTLIGYTHLPSITSWLLILIFSGIFLLIMTCTTGHIIIKRNKHNGQNRQIGLLGHSYNECPNRIESLP